MWVVVSLSDVFCNISGTKYTSVMTRAPPKTHFLDDTAGTRARRHLKTYGGHLLNVLSKQVCLVSPPRPCERLYWFYACSASYARKLRTDSRPYSNPYSNKNPAPRVDAQEIDPKPDGNTPNSGLHLQRGPELFFPDRTPDSPESGLGASF